MFKKIIFFSFLLALLSSCIAENAECGSLRLEFSYTFNKHFEDRLNEVGGINVYMFNSHSGLLASVIPVPQAAIRAGHLDVPMPNDDTYTFVAWGTCSPDMRGAGYQVVQMSNPSAHLYTENVTVGVTTLDNFRKMMLYTQRSSDIGGEVTPQNTEFDNLFHAFSEDVNIDASRENVVELDFMKNTSTLQITVNGLQFLPESRSTQSPLRIFVTGRNGQYYYNNDIGTYTRNWHYEPPHRDLTEDTKLIDIKTQRLVISRHNNVQTPVLLHVLNPETNEEIIDPINIVGAILAARENGMPIWANQEDIDREDEFPITITFGANGRIVVTIKEWVIVDLNPGLLRP